MVNTNLSREVLMMRAQELHLKVLKYSLSLLVVTVVNVVYYKSLILSMKMGSVVYVVMTSQLLRVD